MKKYFNLILIIIFSFIEIFILYNSKVIINDFSNMVDICLYNLLPTMFSSILINQILIKLNFDYYIPNFIKNKFENIDIFLLSIISGYPNNSKLLINNMNMNNIIQYTNFINPIFLIATVGGIYLKNIKLSIIILISHYLSNVVLAIILKNKNIKLNTKNKQSNNSFLKIYSSSLKDTIITLSIIFSNILFFCIIICLIKNMFHINNPLLIGLIEFSSGIYNISISNLSIFLKGLYITIIITFGSFSIHMQIISINNKIKYINYFIFRIINVFISLIFYIIIFNIFFIC